VSATSSSPSVLVSAYDDRTRTTVVAINADAAPVTASFAAPGARGGKVTAVRSGGADRWAPAAVSLTGGDRFIATMPPNSVTTFVVAKS
jgi:O-glycosyl hydrolase